jgi:hypothetical protein
LIDIFASTDAFEDSRLLVMSIRGIRMVTDLPTASSGVKPKSSSAPQFQPIMKPLKSLDRIALTDDSTTAA